MDDINPMRSREARDHVRFLLNREWSADNLFFIEDVTVLALLDLADEAEELRRERDEARADLARLGGPDPDAGLWAELLRLSGLPEGTLKAVVVATLRRTIKSLEDWQAGATGAATISYPPRVGPHTEEAYYAHRAAYISGSEDYRLGADVVAAAVLAAKEGDHG